MSVNLSGESRQGFADREPQELDPLELGDSELFATCWRAGKLRPLMHSSQQLAYDKYRAWEAASYDDEKWTKGWAPRPRFPRIFVMPISKRWGKTSLCLWIKSEDCIRHPGTVHRYASAFQANISEIVNDVSREVYSSCPEELRPAYKGSQGAQGPGFYFPNGSVIRLVGVDLHPNGLRGFSSDGDAFSECGFMHNLFYVVKNVIYHQYQGRPRARLILESSAPDSLDTEWERIFLPDAKDRDACFEATIDDNPLLSADARKEFVDAAGGRGDADCEREYYNVIAVPPRSRVVPEFDPARHVADWPRPSHAHCYTAADPGSRDLFALLWGFWNHERGVLYIEQDWAEPNALTDQVARVIRETELKLWGQPQVAAPDRFAYPEARHKGPGDDVEVIDRWVPKVGAPAGMLTYYDGTWLRANPYRRVSDIDLRLCADLSATYKLAFEPIRKDSAEAMAGAFRDAIHMGRIIVHPRCVRLIATLQAARWNKHRTDWERTTAHGHFDLLACAIYLWRMVDGLRHLNPNPPYRPDVAGNQEVVDYLPWQQAAHTTEQDALRGLMANARGKSKPGQVRVRTHR